jgi:hypothetical protein
MCYLRKTKKKKKNSKSTPLLLESIMTDRLQPHRQNNCHHMWQRGGCLYERTYEKSFRFCLVHGASAYVGDELDFFVADTVEDEILFGGLQNMGFCNENGVHPSQSL